MSAQDPPGLQKVDRILEQLDIDQKPGTLGSDLKEAILELIEDSRLEGQMITGRLLDQVFRGDVLLYQESGAAGPIELMNSQVRVLA